MPEKKMTAEDARGLLRKKEVEVELNDGQKAMVTIRQLTVPEKLELQTEPLTIKGMGQNISTEFDKKKWNDARRTAVFRSLVDAPFEISLEFLDNSPTLWGTLWTEIEALNNLSPAEK